MRIRESIVGLILCGVTLGVGPLGCATHTGEDAVIGGAAGAAVGGAIGSVSHARFGEGALIGGAVGAVAGGLVGNAQDAQEQRDRRYYYPGDNRPPEPYGGAWRVEGDSPTTAPAR